MHDLTEGSVWQHRILKYKVRVIGVEVKKRDPSVVNVERLDRPDAEPEGWIIYQLSLTHPEYVLDRTEDCPGFYDLFLFVSEE